MDLSDEAKAEIKSAIDILKSDGIHIHKTYKSFLASQDPKNPSKDPKNPAENPPPPKPEDPPNDPAPKKAGLWWGTKE